MQERRTDEQANIAKWCVAMLCKDSSGHLDTAFADPQNQTKGFSDALIARCRKLQGKIKTPHLGLGTFNLIISKSDLESYGFNTQTWKQAEEAGLVQSLRYEDVPSYMINYEAASTEFLSRLEAITGKKLADAQALYESFKSAENHTR